MSSWISHRSIQRIHTSEPPTPPSSPVLGPQAAPLLHAVETLKKAHPRAWITFIIPSIGRDSIRETLQSLQAQTRASWVALVLLDGCSSDIAQEMKEDSRILFLSLSRHGNAGMVRNVGMSLAYTPWIGFVDDDDLLHPEYVQQLQTELRQTPYAQCVVFRMTVGDRLIPDLGAASIQLGNVGISFAVRSTTKIRFTDQHAEDFLFLQELDQKRVPIVLSATTMYRVRGADYPAVNSPVERIVLHRI